MKRAEAMRILERLDGEKADAVAVLVELVENAEQNEFDARSMAEQAKCDLEEERQVSRAAWDNMAAAVGRWHDDAEHAGSWRFCDVTPCQAAQAGLAVTS